MELLEKKCENVATLKSLLKEMAMVYQYDLKCEVARHMKWYLEGFGFAVQVWRSLCRSKRLCYYRPWRKDVWSRP